MSYSKYIGRVFDADTGECVELVPVKASGFNHARRLVLGRATTNDGEFIDVKRYREHSSERTGPGAVKAPQLGV